MVLNTTNRLVTYTFERP